MKRCQLALWSAICLILAGCGDGKTPSVSETMTAQTTSGTIRLSHVLARALSSAVTDVRVTGYDAIGGQVYGPVTQPKSTIMEFTSVPVSVIRVRVEYLSDQQITGLAVASVQVSAGGVVTLDDLNYVDVTQPVVGILIRPENPSIPVGAGVSFTATAVFSDGTKADVTEAAEWVSTAPNLVSLSEGEATTLKVGTGGISVSFSGVYASTPFEVTDTPLQSVKLVTSEMPNPLMTGQDFLVSLNGVYSTGTFALPGATFSSGNSAILTIDSAGVVTTLGAGSTTVVGSFGGQQDSVNLTVIGAKSFTDLEIFPSSVTTAPGSRTIFYAVGTLTDGTKIDATNLATWSSNSPDISLDGEVASLSLSAKAGDSAVVSASLNDATATATVDVTAQRFVYVSNGQMVNGPSFNTISQYSVQASGNLTSLGTVAGTPLYSAGLYAHPNGKYVYLAGQDASYNGLVTAYSIGADGTLRQIQAYSIGSGVIGIEGSRGGQYLLVGDYTTPGTITSLKIGDDGTLTASADVMSAPGCLAIVASPDQPLVTALALAGNTSSSVTSFFVKPDGTLSRLGSTVFTAGSPGSLVAGNRGSLYVSGATFLLGPEGPVLQSQPEIANQPIFGVGLEPLGGFIYLMGTDSTQICVQNFLSTGNLLLTTKGTTTLVYSPFVADPSGRFAYSLNFSEVQALSVGPDGSLTTLQSIAAQGVSQDIAVAR